jgi:hypothetical protein
MEGARAMNPFEQAVLLLIVGLVLVFKFRR